METVDTKVMPNQCAPANRRHADQRMSHRIYSIIGFGERTLPAAVAELARYSALPLPPEQTNQHKKQP